MPIQRGCMDRGLAAGNRIAEVLFGDYNFTGTLSHSWPQTNEQATLNKGDAGFEPLFAYGHGLTC